MGNYTKFRGLREVFHTGASPGYCSALYEFPDQHFTVIILTNSSYPIPTLDVGNTAELITQLYLHDQMEMREEPIPNSQIDSGVLATYVGRYDQGFNGIVSVTKKGDDRSRRQLDIREKNCVRISRHTVLL